MISIEQFEKELDLIVKNGYREDVKNLGQLIKKYQQR